VKISEIISDVKARIDCRNLAEEFRLARRWNNYLCPFHDDHNPSLSVWVDGFRCWGCGAKGDAVALYRGLKRVGFLEALEYLASRCGVTVPTHGRKRISHGSATVRRQLLPTAPVPTPANDKPAIDPDRRTAIYTAFAEAGRLRPDHSPHNPAFDYLRRRGISASTAVEAGLAFVTDYSLASHWLRQQANIAELQAVRLFNGKQNFKLFKHRLVIPYWCDGEVAMMQVRNIEWRNMKQDGPKELTIGRVCIPFNADVLLEPQETVYVCEGAIDTLSLLELGFAAVGIPGTRTFRPEWCELFEDVEEVVLGLDDDQAGHAGAEQIAAHFSRFGRTVKRLELPDGVKDINEFLTSVTI